ncbi:MAG: hypothetical protein LIQ31_01080 [Planctomycetes bacterium]|nr:hypothetical protein [Planctomycetota bacterium]
MTYMQEVKATTQTRAWINNPTLEEVDLALAEGAVSCTLNPAFCARVMKIPEKKQYVDNIVKAVVAVEDDDQKAADIVQQCMAVPIMDKFLAIFEHTGGADGLVDIQGSPYNDDTARIICEESLSYSKLRPNFCAKIPIVEAGLTAVREMVRNNIPIIATEVMSVSQAVAAWETYIEASQEFGMAPPLFVTHITGIFDEYLTKYAKDHAIPINDEILAQAGAAVAHKQYGIMKKNGYPGRMLGGGARNTSHFTNMVGGQMDVTMNWKTFAELNALNPRIENRLDSEFSMFAIEELRAKLPDFRRAYDDNGLSIGEFRDFGPVRYFRDSFVAGWDRLVERIRDFR